MTKIINMNLKSKIRTIKDWPKKGVDFKDITPLLEDADSYKLAIDKLAKPFQNQKIDKVVGIDARGFLLAAPIAYKLRAGLAIIRKKGKLPAKTVSKKYSLEYASNTLEMNQDSIKPGERILIVDDVLATGGTMKATCEIVEKLGGEIIRIVFLIELMFLKGERKLKKYKTFSLIEYEK